MSKTSPSSPVRAASSATRASLSPALQSVWAKAPWDPADPDRYTAWLPLTQHALDTFGVAGFIWDDWMSPSLRHLLAAPLGGDQAAARSLFLFLAGAHDAGKASPAFAVQVPELAGAMHEAGLRINAHIAGTDERSMARHELVSYVAVKEWLSANTELSARTATQLASVVGIHHGTAVRPTPLELVMNKPALIGDAAWTAIRMELLEWVAGMAQLSTHARALKSARFGAHHLVLLSALVVVSDWIASNQHYFELFPLGTRPELDPGRARRGWRKLGLPPQWSTPQPHTDVETHFRDRFGFAPRPVQREFARAVSELDEPALLILEAPMGSGKTEAALIAAELRAATTGASGIFLGLPTQATANGMFGRVLRWTRGLPGDVPTTFLAHGKREQNPDFEALLHAAWNPAIAQDDDTTRGPMGHCTAHDAVVHRWLSDRRRGPLAAFVTGTVDQALMASLRSRYAQLRHLALATKVVVIDEAHAYSSFMNVYLDRTLHWLGAYGTTVVILSATLPSRRRAELVAAYESGRRQAATGRTNLRGRPDPLDEALTGDIGYPAITVSRSTGASALTVAGDGASTEIELRRIRDTPDAIADELESRLRDGGCAAIIHNTVARVQTTAATLRRRLPDVTVIVAHANFLAADRAALDRKLLALFGSPTDPDVQRPRRAIVVGTQVIEQSLDIDFDVMVSDLAPVDLLLQRSGRLHRHQRDDRPAPVTTARLIITGVDWSTTPPTPNPVYSKIYDPFILLRTLHALRDRQSLTVPEDISPLVQTVYGEERIADPEWSDLVDAAQQRFESEQDIRVENARQFQLNTVAFKPDLREWNTGGTNDPDTSGKAASAVRDGGDSLEVLAVWEEGGSLLLPSWLPEVGGEFLPDLEPPDRIHTRALLSCALRLPYRLCVPDSIDAHIAELEKSHPAQAWRTSPELKRELVLVFNSEGYARVGNHELHYTPENGLEIVGAE